MEFGIIPDQEALSNCAWCQNPISDEMEVFGIGVKLNQTIDLSMYESHCIEIGLISEEKQVYMMVTTEGSEAKKSGKDGMFLVCSEFCGQQLKNALEKDISLGKLFITILAD
jgi:hypothetical protein